MVQIALTGRASPAPPLLLRPGGSGNVTITERGISMSRYRSARAVLAGAAVIALAGCGSAAGTSFAASSNSPAGAA